MKFVELVSKTESELHQICGDLKKELLNLRVQAKVNQTVNVLRFRQCRRDIARIHTRLKQLKIA